MIDHTGIGVAQLGRSSALRRHAHHGARWQC